MTPEIEPSEIKSTGGYKRKIVELFKQIPNEDECSLSDILYRLQTILNEYASQQSAALESENKRLRQALKEIEQMSDPGRYEWAIAEMKSIATDALNQELAC